MKKHGISLLFFCMITLSSVAQTVGYKFYSKLDTVKSSGFYNIELGSVLNAYIKPDYSDVRIVNESGKWIPHVLHNRSTEITNHLVDFDLKFTKTESPDFNTILIIENSIKKSINNIGLSITNTEAEKFCSLSGSNDQQNWFIINDSILIKPMPASEKTVNTFTINFPPSDYRFFKIIIDNKNKDPFLIKGITNRSAAYSNKDFPFYGRKKIENPAATILQKDSGKITYVKITQQQPFHVDKISLELSGVKYFNRKADLFIPDGEGHSFSNPGRLLQTISISNNSTLEYNMPLTKSKVFYLLINNEDNLPFKVSKISSFCSNHFLTAYLEAGNTFRLIMDNQFAVAPNYDLSNLDNKITDSIPLLSTSNVLQIAENIATNTKTDNNKWILWASIAAALLILLFFTSKMLKEVDKRKTT